MFLDELPIIKNKTHFGNLGTYGNLGFSNDYIKSDNIINKRSIAAHAPSEIIFQLDGRYNSFRSRVAFNSTAGDNSSATFLVYADSELIACVPNVNKTQVESEINVNIYNANTLTLKIETSNPIHCHTCWINPRVDTVSNSSISDVLDNIEVDIINKPITVNNCYYTITTESYVKFTSNMINSLFKQTDMDSAVVILGCDLSDTSIEYLKSLGTIVINCRIKEEINNISSIKMLIYRIANIVWANNYIFLDSDIIVCKDLSILWQILDYSALNTILGVKFTNKNNIYNLEQAILSQEHFNGLKDDIKLLGITEIEQHYTATINSGVFAASKRAMLCVDSIMQTFNPMIRKWEAEYDRCNFREEAIFIMTLARLQSAVLLRDTFNIQMHDIETANYVDIDKEKISYKGDSVYALHFSGNSKRQGLYQKVIENNHEE